MTERAASRVETVELDLPPLAAALSRRLHEAGLPATPARAAEFARALTIVQPIARRRLYYTARALFVSDRSQIAAFDAVFFEIFGGRPSRAEGEDAAAGRTVAVPPDDRPERRRDDAADAARAGEEDRPRIAAEILGERSDGRSEEDQEVEVPVLASAEELLRTKSFDALEPGELAALYRLMSRLALAPPPRRTRRYVKGHHGGKIDMRRTLRESLRTGGDPVALAHRRRRVSRRRLVMLCDISGSMEPYTRAYLQLLTCAAGGGHDAEVFVFATRLTRLTRALATRSPDQALRRAAAAAPDWASGTRIGEALRTFNDRYGRRGMARGAVVVILSDGWERGDPTLVGREMARLARLAHRVVWVNPRAAAAGFSVAAAGMVAALPHCDALVSGHSFAALGEVVEAIAAPGAGRRVAQAAPQQPPEQPEPWPSATPVAGSSVAMPSGDRPARGRTTPGWDP
ncbi:MAG TPA: VWA domain-containing protein [Solirubrobacteraceae bacterium]